MGSSGRTMNIRSKYFLSIGADTETDVDRSQGPLVNTEEGKQLQEKVWKEILTALQGVSAEVEKLAATKKIGST